MYILGISAFYHDSAAALLKDGRIIAAAQEERFTRIKHDSGFPINAINYCLSSGNISAKEVDYIGFYEKPFIKFERILFSHLATFPKSFISFLIATPMWLKEKLWIPSLIRKQLSYQGEVLLIEHHLSHAGSSFLVSPFKEAAILTIDGVGEWSTGVCGIGKDNQIELYHEMRFPHSLGLLYSAFTYYLGFKVNSAEYKVMGLAPYGKPIYYDLIMRELVDLKEDGSFKLNMRYFSYDHGLKMTNNRLDKLFGSPRRVPESEITKLHKDIASSLQKVTEEIVLRMANNLYEETGLKKLCLAGGVALNCLANSRILKETPFKEVFIQPGSSDAGGAVGVAAYIHYTILNNKRNFVWEDAYLGPGYSNEEIKGFLNREGLNYREYKVEELLKLAAKLLSEQNIIGWFQGRMEFGPRALGNRSILADPRNADNKDRVNQKVKYRESFRPFAPSVIQEKAAEFFEIDRDSPFMLLTFKVKNNRIPAVTHVDFSARLQTVRREDNLLFYGLLKEFGNLTGCPVLLNTSFNLRGEPIVCTPREAYLSFMRSGIDYLIMGNFVLDKKEMAPLKEEFSCEKMFAQD
ncbi:MAG: carbamoyltransferase [candidate division Zixibacteria bacterium]|nr:carbamoyltransferase [candidate division Zixibacteria bacterium]